MFLFCARRANIAVVSYCESSEVSLKSLDKLINTKHKCINKRF